MSFSPIQKLAVRRTLATGASIQVGVLAQNRQGVFFQYDADYLTRFGSLSPFMLDATSSLQRAPKQPHDGLHGVFADSLPDGWGLLLQDRVFRQHGILPSQVTSMDRLAFVGEQGMGALTFSPASDYAPNEPHDLDLATLGTQAEALFDQAIAEDLEGQTQEVLSTLVAVGSSGGARPKAQIFMAQGDANSCRTVAQPEDEAWLVKFTSSNLALGHEEGVCEAVYLQMAELAHCQPPPWQLISAPSNAQKKTGALAWLAVKRFDYLPKSQAAGRLHMHSACGLLGADFRTPSLDYQDLFKASRQLCKSPSAGQLQFRRAMFNLFSANQDDHSKNWAFLQDDAGHWSLAPFFDVTYSPHPFNEHATAFGGYGKQPPLKTMQKLAVSAGFSAWKEAQYCIEEVVEALSHFTRLAKETGVKSSTIKAIEKTLEQRRTDNKELLSK